VTSTRIVSDAFFFDFSHATCDGVKNTATRSVFFSFAAAIALLQDAISPQRHRGHQGSALCSLRLCGDLFFALS